MRYNKLTLPFLPFLPATNQTRRYVNIGTQKLTILREKTGGLLYIDHPVRLHWSIFAVIAVMSLAVRVRATASIVVALLCWRSVAQYRTNQLPLTFYDPVS